jgi:hypothetical protein
MPVIVVSAASLGSDMDDRAALARINHAVAAPLELADSAVYSVLHPATLAMLGDATVSPWPVAIVHGSARPQMPAALAALRETLAAVWEAPADGVWAQWHVTS